MRSVFLAPHPDDETLFGAFTLLRERPLVVCVLDCGRDRRDEFFKAMRKLGCKSATLGYIAASVEHPEVDPDWDLVARDIRALHADRIYAPAPHPDGNTHHNRCAEAAATSGASEVIHYLTYTTAGKQTDGREVEYELPWIGQKLRALATYETQYGHPSHAPHFLRDQREFYA